MNMKLILNPTLEEFAKLSIFTKGPLLKDGYYGFIADSIFLVEYEGIIVGYLTYRMHEVYVDLDCIFVAPEYRRKGIATFLVEQALKYFIERGVCAAEIEAVTPEGCAHAHSLKFHKIKEQYDWREDQYHTTFTKILCSYRKQSRKAKNMLAIWKKDYWTTKPDKDPDMSWPLGNNKLPIIFRCSPADWTAAIIVDGQIIKQELINNLLHVYSTYVRLETDETDVYPYIPECMKGTKYTHW